MCNERALNAMNLWPNFQNKNIPNNFRKISNIFSTVLMLVELVMHDFITDMNRTYNAAEKFYYMMEMSNVRTDFWNKLYIYLNDFPTVSFRNIFFVSFEWTDPFDGNFRSVLLVLSNVPFFLLGHSFSFLANVLILLALLLSIKLYRFRAWLRFPLIIFWIFKLRRSTLILLAVSFVIFKRILASWFTVRFPFAVNWWWPLGSESEPDQLKSNLNM